jgi:hypothetical protein
MGPLLARFIQERKYLRNVTRTIEWHEQARNGLALSRQQSRTSGNLFCECGQPDSCGHSSGAI